MSLVANHIKIITIRKELNCKKHDVDSDSDYQSDIKNTAKLHVKIFLAYLTKIEN